MSRGRSGAGCKVRGCTEEGGEIWGNGPRPVEEGRSPREGRVGT